MIKKNKKPDRSVYRNEYMDAYANNGGDHASACEATGVSQTQVNAWRIKYQWFDRAIKDIDNYNKQAVVRRLYQHAMAGDISAAIWYLDRGVDEQHPGLFTKIESNENKD